MKRVFAKAAGLDGPQREAYLKEVGRKDRVIHREVESLLARHDKPDNFLDPPSSVAGGTVLSHYKVGRQIGKGGMGVVYQALDTSLDRLVALKFLPPWAVANPRFRQRLLREARSASALSHPNIVTVYGLGKDRGVDFIVMEYAAGRTLESVISARGLSVDLALGFALQIADALVAAHTAGILHGDLKPPNIQVTDDRRVKLLDFGLARALASRHEASEAGPSVYMAPEQLEDIRHAPDPRSEIFSFGLILHQMLSGRHPFKRGTREAILTAIRTKAPRPLPGKAPSGLATVVSRCLQKNPTDRYASMKELLVDLRICQRTTATVDGHPVAEAPTPSAEIRRVRTLARRIGYDNVAQSRQALTEMERLLTNASPAARQTVTSVLRKVILTLDQENGVSSSAREVRRITLDVLRVSTQGRLAECFKDGELETLDLYEINFAGEALAGVSFKRCFLVAANFQGCDLSGASFAGAWIRNVDFSNAVLAGADMTDADWFNASGLTESQLRSVQPGTLLECPPDVRAMRQCLEARYGYYFESWSTQVQEQLRAAWKEYLCPAGLRDIVASWRKK